VLIAKALHPLASSEPATSLEPAAKR